MALTVNTNTAAINALTNYQHTNRQLNNSFQKISSGLRVTKAADDAAGLAVAENLDAQSMSMRQAKRNINDGMSIAQTAEGAINTAADIFKRVRELLVESSSDTLNSDERAYIKTEGIALLSEYDRTMDTLEFNGIKLAPTTGAVTINVQVGVHNTANDRIGLTLEKQELDDEILLQADGADFDTASASRGALSKADTAIDLMNTDRTTIGAFQNRLNSALNNAEVYTENLDSAQSQIRDADFAHETAEMAKFQIMAQAGTAVLAQANQINQGALRLLG